MIADRPKNSVQLFLEAWPKSDLAAPTQRLLALAQQTIALHVARAAAQAGLSAMRLTAASAVSDGGRAIFVGWGSGSLLTPAHLMQMASVASDGRVWGNRPLNADIWAFSGSSVPDFRLPPQTVFPPSAATLFRLETGSDLCLLATFAPNLLAETALALPDPRVQNNIRDASRMMTKRTAEILVIGDPGCAGWQYLERDTACRVRLLADSRGGLLSALLESAGPRRFVQDLGDLGDAALVNTRILFREAAFPSADDFFHSDLGDPTRITNPGLRGLTEELLASGKPFVLGGNSLMNGGIYLLVEQAWQNQELARQFSVLNA